mgnify:CR=1 FL=1
MEAFWFAWIAFYPETQSVEMNPDNVENAS